MFRVIFFLLLISIVKPANVNSSYIVMERSSKRILEGANIHDQMLIASTAKVLTAITVLENFNLDEEVIVDESDINEIGSKVYLSLNDVIKRRDLLYALLLRSANDAASALSNNNDSEFMYLMNETAKKIGMNNSVFENASGLDEGEYNLSTAYDLALLGCYACENTTFIEIASTHTYKCNTKNNAYSWGNKHKLVKNNENFLWGKTGYTKKSKRILISNYIDNNMDLIIVTINRGDDYDMHINLAEECLKYDFKTIFDKGINEVYIDKKYYIFINRKIVIPIKDNEYENLHIKFIIYPSKAIMHIYVFNKVVAQYDFIVKEEVDVDDYIYM